MEELRRSADDQLDELRVRTRRKNIIPTCFQKNQDMDAEEKARIEAEMAEKLEALALMENEKREKDEELERIRLQVHTNAFSFPQNNIVLTTKSVVLRKHRII